MLPFVLVLLIASSALAAPYVEVNQVSINDIPRKQSNGRLVSNILIENAFEIVDGGDTNVNILTAVQNLNDLANRNDPTSQALAISQAVAILSQLSTGVAGDACAASNAVDAYVRNPSGARGALASFVQGLASSIDTISQLATNPNSVRYATGPRGNCNAGGRSYSFEAAWDSILSSSSSASAGLVNEQYCVAKRLYNGFNSRSNNVGAYITAVSLPSVNQAFQRVIGPLANFLSAVGNGNPGAAAGQAKQALLNAARSL